MKRTAIIALLIISAFYAKAQGPEDSSKLAELDQRIRRVEIRHNRDYGKLMYIMEQQGKGLIETNTNLTEANATLANIEGRTEEHFSEIDSTFRANEIERNKGWVVGIVISITIASIAGYAFIDTKKRKTDIEFIRRRVDDLNRQIVERMGNELEVIKEAIKASGSAEQDLTLIKAIADRISFIEMTLYRMDPKVKGHKQIKMSIKNIKDNLKAHGFEIVDMIGLEYTSGMKATPSFIDDETLDRGRRIITAVTKPQINYNGQMIQAAQITVSQNI